MLTPRCTIKKNEKKHNEYKVTLTLTHGEILSMKHALELYTASAISQDVLCYLTNAFPAGGLPHDPPCNDLRPTNHNSLASQIDAVEQGHVQQR